MPRVYDKRANVGAKKKTCGKCNKEIKPGDRYYTWSFRYGGTYLRHVSCGHPRQSELTQSKLSGVYAAQEDGQAAIDEWDGEEASDIAQALNDAAEAAREVATEYEDGIQNMPDSLQQGSVAEEMQEKADAINAWADELESAASDVEGEDKPEEPDLGGIRKQSKEAKSDPDQDAKEAQEEYEGELDNWRDEVKSKAQGALDNLNV